MQWNEEAEEIMRERFGGDNEMALATCRGSRRLLGTGREQRGA